MDKFDEFLNEATRESSNNVPGAVVAVVSKSGQIIYKNVKGFNSILTNAEPLDFNQTFFLASCTKLITSITALQAVERGLIGLDEALDKRLPELAVQPIIEPRHDSSFELHTATKPITLRHLLTHSSRAVYDVIDPTLALWRQSRGETPRFRTSGIVTKDYDLPRIFGAGESWMYGQGLDWASLLVCRLNGMNIEKYVEENIAKPLGITSFTWHLPRKPHVEKKLMRMSTRGPDGILVDGADLVFPTPVDEGGSGGLGMYANVADYVRVLADLLKDCPILLKTETVDLLFEAQFPPGSKTLHALDANNHIYQHMTGRVGPGYCNYTLGGLLVTKDIEFEGYFKPQGTMTWDGKPNLHWSINRRRGLAMIFATQVLPSGDAKTQALGQTFETAVWRNLSSMG